MIQEYYKNMRVLVTGGCGFIGSHLVQKLVAHGARVTVLDNLSNSSITPIENILHKITFIEKDIRDFDACMMTCKEQEFIFHQAAYISVPGSIENPTTCHENNVVGTFNLLQAAKKNKIERFIFASSASIYGHHEGICHETIQPNPSSPYGFSKLINELYAQQYAQNFGLNTIGLRYFNVYGSHQHMQSTQTGIVAKLHYQMAHNLPITIFGDGTQTRDFVHVNEVINANLNLALQDPALTKGHVFNIATGSSISLLTLIEQIKKMYPNYTGEIVFQPKQFGDVTHSRADCSKYKNLINTNRITTTQSKIELIQQN